MTLHYFVMKEDDQDALGDIRPDLTIPISMRVPMREAYQLQLYTEQINTSTGKLMSDVLEDILPAVTRDDPKVKIRSADLYTRMKSADLLKAVNTQDLKQRILKRGEGPVGRPKKGRKAEEES